MKYVLVYLIRGKAEKYHQKLVKSVGPKFGEDYMIKNPLPSHITLKSPFKKEQMKYLEKALKKFAEEHKATKIKINGFGNFRRFVAFLKIKFSKEAKKIQKELLETIQTFKDIEISEFDRKYKPHSTITYGNTSKSFNKIWDYLSKLDKPKFNLSFDNITILKKPREYWKIHRIYELR
ncbi:MAG: 2'-5' RNA ligase family protein [Candidatus Pacearchaeota archaeon]|jgi:2'-5' RNA ligase